MVSVQQAIVRRVEVGTWIEDRVKEGYNFGSWEHIKQSPNVLIKAWKREQTRAIKSKPKEWRTPKRSELVR